MTFCHAEVQQDNLKIPSAIHQVLPSFNIAK